MMEASKCRVALRDIVPSETNPRGDFGDIAALAETIRATGGEPVNPPVLVRDGNICRIVDGERRYRALCEIYGEGSEREVDAIVYDSFDEANELVAMLATDDKKPLTEAEVSRGVQQMLVLGVDTERAARASRAPRGKVTAMRMMAGRAPEGVQVTLDQALAASELPDEDAEAVLAAGDSWRWEVSKIKSRIAEEERAEKRLEALAKAGVEVVPEKPEGLVAIRTVYPYVTTPAALGKEARELGPECVAMVDPDGTVRFFGPEGAGAKALTQEELDRERSMGDSSDLYDRIAAWVLSGEMDVCDGLVESVKAERGFDLRYGRAESDEAYKSLLELAEERERRLTQVSRFECENHLLVIAKRDIHKTVAARNTYEHDDQSAAGRCRGLLDAVELAAAAGFETDERDEWLLGKCAEMAGKLEGADA